VRVLFGGGGGFLASWGAIEETSRKRLGGGRRVVEGVGYPP